MQNTEIARRLEEVAWLLNEQGANPYRVQAYRRAAETLRRLAQSVTEILQREGAESLRRLPGIGESLARSIREVVLTGRLPILDRLRGESDPMSLFVSVPGIGPVLAERLHHDLGIDTLEELEAAAHDGCLTNTARAHQLGKTHDWAVLYYDGGRGERQCTVITSQRGPLAGKRIVRSREGECALYYQ
jgi:DNA polymerase/3'-5' exonuclease PolX